MTYFRQLILFGRGGMGVVTAAEILAEAVAQEGKYGQSLPFFGMERRGAPVRSFVRISSEPIWVRSEVTEPDYVIVVDQSLLTLLDVTRGLKTDGMLIVNSSEKPQILKEKLQLKFRVATVNATKIALEEIKVPIASTAMLGAFAKVTNEISLESIRKAVLTRLSGEIGQKNIRAIERAYKEVLF